MRSLPLFHRVAGRPVIVLGEGAAAEPKRLLVERAGGEVVADLDEGLARGARIAFVAHPEQARCEIDATRLQQAGLLVNVVDRPELCDFTTPSILDRDPVLVAVGTAGTSAGLAKQLRLRLEALLPPDLGRLALALQSARSALRRRWPNMAARRGALDVALSAGGPLDPIADGAADRVAAWLANPAGGEASVVHEMVLASDDPDDLTLRQARLLGTADAVWFEPRISAAILNRARADALRRPLETGALPDTSVEERLVLVLRRI